MFERYTQEARRVIFYARQQASEFGSPYIETEHVLLGLLMEDKSLASRVLPVDALKTIRAEIQSRTPIREKIPTNVDMPLSNEGKRVLNYAAKQADQLQHKQIGTEHLMLGLLLEKKCFAAALLDKQGLNFSRMRVDVERFGSEDPEP